MNKKRKECIKGTSEFVLFFTAFLLSKETQRPCRSMPRQLCHSRRLLQMARRPEASAFPWLVKQLSVRGPPSADVIAFRERKMCLHESSISVLKTEAGNLLSTEWHQDNWSVELMTSGHRYVGFSLLFCKTRRWAVPCIVNR